MKKNYLVGYKLFFGLLGFSAIVTEYAVLWSTNALNIANFFSYFTIEANTLAFIVFIASAFYIFADKKSRKLDFARAAATYSMILTGIVFAIMLSGLEGVKLTAVPWDNIVLHYIVPIAALIDYFMDPPKYRISYKKGLLWLLFPFVYLVYSLLRGPIAHFYPYPFLNPANNGYGYIAFVAVCIIVASLVINFGVTKFSGEKK